MLCEVIVNMFVLVILSVFVTNGGAAVCNVSEVDAMLAEYDFTVPPSDEPVEVSLHLDARHVSVREETAQMKMLADLKAFWNDSRLSWNVSEWGCDFFMVARDKIWGPELDVEGTRASDVVVRVDSEGQVMISQRLNINALLSFVLRDWPKDSHSAEFTVISPVDRSRIKFVISDQKFLTLHESGSWEIGSIVASLGVWEDRALAMWTLSVRRRQPALVLAARSVIACSALLVLSTLIMPPQHRVSLALVAVLCTSIWLSSCVSRLPPSQGTPVCVWTVAAMTGVAATTALSGCTHNSTPLKFLISLLAKFKITSKPNGEVMKIVDLVTCAVLFIALIIILFIYLCS